MDISDEGLRSKLILMSDETASRKLIRLYDMWHGKETMPYDTTDDEHVENNQSLRTVMGKHFLTSGILACISRAVAPAVGESSASTQYLDIFRLTEKFNPGTQGTDS